MQKNSFRTYQDQENSGILTNPRVAQRGALWRESAPGRLSFTPRERVVMDKGFFA
jgi:hypothetical protein